MKEEISLGFIFKKHRALRGLSQQEVADSIGVNRLTYNKYETDKTIPSFDLVIELAKLFVVPLESLSNKNQHIIPVGQEKEVLEKINGIKDLELLRQEAFILARHNSELQKEVKDLKEDLLKVIRDLR